MNILYIDHYVGSPEMGMEFRPYYLAREWIKLGHNVTIVGATFSHLRKKQPITKKVFTEEKIDNIPYLWIKTPKYKRNSIGRMTNMLTFVVILYTQANKLAKKYKPDVVIASSTYPFDIYAAHRIAKLANARLVFETHDLWPMSPQVLGGYSEKHPYIRGLQIAEDYMCKHVDKVVSIIPYADRHYVTRGLEPDKYFHVSNGIVKEDWENCEELPEEHNRVIKKLKEDNKYLIGYAGGLSVSNAMEYIIDASKYVDKDKCSIVIVGDGKDKQKLMQQVQDIGAYNVVFLPAISKKVIPKYLEQMDVLILSTHKSKLYQYGVSLNKLYDYMMAAKPIICAMESANNPVDDAQCGITVESEKPKSIAEAINKMIEMDKMCLEKMGIRGKKFILKNNEYETLASRFLEIIIK